MGQMGGMGDAPGAGLRGNNNAFRPAGNRPDAGMFMGAKGGRPGQPPGFGRPGGSGMGGVLPGGLAGGSPGIGSDAEEEENLSLLEVAVYGIASIYERFPPKPPEAAAPADAAGQPGAPAKP